MAKTTIATTAEPNIKSGPTEVSDAELEGVVGGSVCCACSDNSCRL